MSAANAPALAKAIADDYRSRKEALVTALHGVTLSARGARTVLEQLAGLTDDTLRRLWRHVGLRGHCTLMAVGGYGRSELFPCSDVDVTLLLPADKPLQDHDFLRQRIEAFIGLCWDTGIEVGSSVRTIDECLELSRQDLTVQTALLEARRVTGSRKLYVEFRRRFATQMDPLEFFAAKRMEMRQRHHKYADTPYALEPNCKESPGGLRDLQTILWVTHAAGIGRHWDDLRRAGLATAHEVRELHRNEALLARVRMRLHLVAGRHEDRLVFDLQSAVAESFGLEHRITADGRMALRASELLMRRYYWAAKAVTQLRQILLQNIEAHLRATRGLPTPVPRPINERFFELDGRIEVADDELYWREPQAVLETFLLLATRDGIKGLSTRTLRALYNARPVMNRRFRRDPQNQQTFLAILQQPQGTTRAFRLMNQTSVLGRYLWVFRRIVGQMQHDLFHVYTVDQHTLMVLRNMRRFFIPEHAHEYPFCSRLAAGWDQPWVLYVAALFHDIAKGRGGDHSRLGAHEVSRFCRQHGVSGDDAHLIIFLVREHLAMSQVAQKQDLSDPDVIAAFARRVGSVRRLTALYLLTVADIRGTSPKVWSAWKGKLLEDLYRLTVRALGGRAPDPDALVEWRKREALSLLASQPHASMTQVALWDTLDMGYFMRHDSEEIAWHARRLADVLGPAIAAGTALPQVTAVAARRSPLGEGLQVLIHTPDRRDLFARICGCFQRSGLSILDARIHTTSNGWALDTFQVSSGVEVVPDDSMLRRVERALQAAINSADPLPSPSLGRASARVRSFPVAPRVELRPDEKALRWLLRISASDRTGLLYAIAHVLANYNINVELARVTTLGERVEDLFLVHGERLQNPRMQLLIERRLLQALSLPHPPD